VLARVMVWCASTEAYQEAGPEHQSIAAFEKALDADHPNIYPSQLYLVRGDHERSALPERRSQHVLRLPRPGGAGGEARRRHRRKDFKTGQT